MEDVTPTEGTEEEAAAPATPSVPPSSKVDGKGRDRGALEVAVKGVTDEFDQGTLSLADGEFLTPHRIATEIKRRENRAVSAGAVSATLDKWFDLGYAKLNQKPKAFVGYTDDAFNVGLAGLKERAKEARKAAKAEAKAAAEAEAPAEAPAEEPTPAPVETPVVETPPEDDPNPVGAGV